MKTLWIAVFMAAFAIAQPPPVLVASSRDWKRLKATAKTPAEFHALAAYCERKAEEERLKAHECRRSLRLVLEHPTTYGRSPKWPPPEQTLGQLIANYQASEAKWTALARDYRKH